MKQLNIYIILIIIFLSLFQICLSEKIVVNDVLKNDIVLSSSEDSVTILVFANNPCCHDCFLKLNKVLQQIKLSDSPVRIYAVISTQSDIVSRKLGRNYFRDLIKVDSIYYDIIDNYVAQDSLKKQSLFGHYNIRYTPAVLLVFKDESIFISLKDLQNSGYGIVKEIVAKLLKK